jgi:hypothetical protein
MSRKEGEKMDYPIIDWEKQKQKKVIYGGSELVSV